jgi:hypothetical protein
MRWPFGSIRFRSAKPKAVPESGQKEETATNAGEAGARGVVLSDFQLATVRLLLSVTDLFLEVYGPDSAVALNSRDLLKETLTGIDLHGEPGTK